VGSKLHFALLASKQRHTVPYLAAMEGSPSIADKLARLAKLENDFQRALEVQKLEAMAEFAAGAGHEINNPLTVISGRAQLLLREESDPERQHALALISAQAMRVYEMIADMMLFARPPRPEFQPVELVKLVDDLTADFLPRCQGQDTAICRTGDSEPIHIQADPTQINVALRAICQNSMEALGSGGHVEIDLGHGADEATIRIRDDGPGIKPEERRHIFDPFYSARQAGRGLGLGLCKAWRIIANHGGRIEVESQSSRGATFSVVLPIDLRD
jgi:signal transduction histidine kinase